MPITAFGSLASGGPGIFAPYTSVFATIHTAMLVEAGSGEEVYRHADAGAKSGALLAGADLFLVSRVTRVRRRDDGAQIRIHDNPDVDSLSAILANRDVRVCIHSAAGIIVSAGAGLAGGNYANWSFAAEDAPQFAAIAERERFWLVLGEPA